MKGWTLGSLVLCIAFVAPLLAGSATAADVNQTIVVSNFAFHLGTASGASPPSITVAPGDRLVLRIENQDSSTPDHTFTSDHFPVNVTLPDGTPANPSVIFVNITTSSSDVGTWQFYCIPHSSPGGNTRSGMVGSIVVQSPAPPRTPGFETLAAIGALATAFLAVAVWRRR